ncbi:MAG: hypothetical protein OEM05_03830 [Myxococcales bacterium]|nr:hypothetical protein [Myxococcales bacterium]
MSNRAEAGLKRAVSRAWWVPGSVFVWVLSVSLILTGYHRPASDASHYHVLTRAIVLNHTLDCTGAGIQIEEANLLVGKDGSRYTKYAPGQSLVQVPAHFLGNLIAPYARQTINAELAEILSLRTTPALLTAAATTVLFLVLRSYFGVSTLLSLMLALLYFLGTQAFSYAKSNFSEALQAFCIISCAAVLLKPDKRWSLVIASFMFGLLVLTKPALLVCGPAYAYLIYQKKLYKPTEKHTWVIAAIVAGAMASFLLYYNYIRTGSVFDLGYGDDEFSTGDNLFFFKNIWNLLFLPSKSILMYNLILIFALPGYVLLRDRSYRIFFAILVGCLLLLYGPHRAAWSGSYGQRYMVPVIILAIPFVGATLERVLEWKRWPRIASMGFVGLVCFLSIYVSFLGVAYFRYAGMHFCQVHDALAEQYGFEECESSYANNKIAIYHYLFWNDDFDERVLARERGEEWWKQPRSYEEFPWISEKLLPTAATRVLRSRALNRYWVTKDFLFFSPNFADRSDATKVILYCLYLLTGLSTAGILAAGWNEIKTAEHSRRG